MAKTKRKRSISDQELSKVAGGGGVDSAVHEAHALESLPVPEAEPTKPKADPRPSEHDAFDAPKPLTRMVDTGDIPIQTLFGYLDDDPETRNKVIQGFPATEPRAKAADAQKQLEWQRRVAANIEKAKQAAPPPPVSGHFAPESEYVAHMRKVTKDPEMGATNLYVTALDQSLPHDVRDLAAQNLRARDSEEAREYTQMLPQQQERRRYRDLIDLATNPYANYPQAQRDDAMETLRADQTPAGREAFKKALMEIDAHRDETLFRTAINKKLPSSVRESALNELRSRDTEVSRNKLKFAKDLIRRQENVPESLLAHAEDRKPNIAPDTSSARRDLTPDQRTQLGAQKAELEQDLAHRLVERRAQIMGYESTDNPRFADDTLGHGKAIARAEGDLEDLGKKGKLRQTIEQNPDYERGLPSEAFAPIAAAAITNTSHVPKERRSLARKEMTQVIEQELQNKDVAGRMMRGKGAKRTKISEVVVVPRDKRVTELPEFADLAEIDKKKGIDQITGHRKWADTRGSAGNRVSVGEETLFGENPDIAGLENGKPHPKGYTATHEFGHAVKFFGLSPEQAQIVRDVFRARLEKSKANPHEEMWTDGPLNSYASLNEEEFWAQMTSTYFGSNVEQDPHTGARPANNREWIRKNEPEMFRLLEEVYRGARMEKLERADAPPEETPRQVDTGHSSEPASELAERIRAERNRERTHLGDITMTEPPPVSRRMTDDSMREMDNLIQHGYVNDVMRVIRAASADHRTPNAEQAHQLMTALEDQGGYSVENITEIMREAGYRYVRNTDSAIVISSLVPLNQIGAPADGDDSSRKS